MTIKIIATLDSNLEQIAGMDAPFITSCAAGLTSAVACPCSRL